MRMYGNSIGIIWLTPQPPYPPPTGLPGGAGNTIAQNFHTQVIETGLPNSTISNLTASSGEVVDDIDPTFTITYDISDDSLAIPLQEILTAVLDAQTITASLDLAENFDWITGVSVGGKTVLAITRKPGKVMSCAKVSRALILITTFPVINQKKFMEMAFEMRIRGEVVGTAVLFRVRPLED